jgi:hypothetical protein
MSAPSLYPSSVSAYSGVYDFAVDELPTADEINIPASVTPESVEGLFTQAERFYSKHLLIISMLQTLVIVYLLLKMRK